MRPATKESFKIHGWRNVHDFIHGYHYFKYIDLYVRVIPHSCRLWAKLFPRHAWAQKYHARKIPQDEALRLMAGPRDGGHVHTAWFKDACGKRMYATCNTRGTVPVAVSTR